MSYEPDRAAGRYGCIAALPVMFVVYMLFIGVMVGGCNIDSDEAQCALAEQRAAWLLLLIPLSGLAIFLVVRWGVSRWRRPRS